ncbi:MAG TPA: asparagine synthase (glutamine-hydrolyzing) [Ferruginibacter sp.]|nr:asparagine synthase (glutamine-hydrolyzing) [Ferruginibacter sp.]
MCGIAGIISAQTSLVQLPVLRKMSKALAHRGPDGEGHWISRHGHAGLAHRRLKVIDLSEAGAQPMHYLDRYSIVFNGEIYNYIELRKELKKAGYYFISNSDTEVVLAAFDYYREECLHYFDGMFAFAIWDDSEQVLFAGRDRFGEKPLYYFVNDEQFLFGSEMKALWSAGVPRLPERKMILNYITLGYVQNPANKAQTFFKDIFSLPAAHYLEYRPHENELQVTEYWKLDKQALISMPEKDAMDRFEELFLQSLQKRLRSDVPLGASLSGGLDSSTIVYYLQQQLRNASTSYKTFSAVFPGFEQDESAYIQQMVRTLHIENYSTSPTEAQLIDDFEKLAYYQEEPFPSSSIYAQYKVYALAKATGVTVLLDGQGADEMLAGYHKYAHWYLQEMISRYRFTGAKKERLLMMENNIRFTWTYRNLFAAFLPSHASIALEKNEYNRIIQHPDITREMMSLLRGREWEGIHKPVVTKLNDILYFNTMQYGLEELLRYADRNSMAHGVEVRLPYLNAELVQFVFSLPSNYKIRDGYTKHLLRKLMDHKLPHSIVWRTDKVAFEPPQKQWMDSPQLTDYIFEARQVLVDEQILKPQVLQKKSKGLPAHAADNFDWRYLCVARLLQS